MRCKLVVLILLSLFSPCLRAQKVKSQTVEGTSIHYPIVALPAAIKTYAVKAQRVALDSIEFNRLKNPSEKISLQAFTRVASGADLNIRIRYGNLKLYQFASPTVIKSLNELNGASFNTMIEYTVDITFEVTDSKGIVIQKETYLNGTSFQTGGTTDVPKRQAKATDAVSTIVTTLNEGFEACNVRIKDLFDTYREKFPLEFYAVKPSKTETYEDYATAFKTIERAFSQPQDEPALRKTIQPSLDFWEQKMASLNPTANEDEKSYFFLCTYNLAAAYCYLDDFDKATTYLEKAKANDYKPGYVGLLKNQIAKRKKMKDQYVADKAKTESNPDTIYLKSEPATSSPGSIFDLKKKTDAPAGSDYLEKGFVILSPGDTTFGKFVEFDLNLKKGVISFVPNGGSKRDFVKPYREIRFLSVHGDVHLFHKSGAPLQLVYASEYLTVISVSSVEVSFVFNTGEPVYYKTFDPNDGASFVTNYKKKFAEVFKGVCPTVEEKALKGSYELKKEGIKPLEPAIRDYETACGSKQYEKYQSMFDRDTVTKKYK